jgi:dinuclear metal center YbgI/SA1388 family protein
LADTIKLNELVSYLNSTLNMTAFKDASLNGLQVEGAEEVSRIAIAVDAGLSVIQEAASRGVDAILVHHGIFWGSCFPISGAKKELFQTLLENNLSLLAYHLPLDAHLELGNNAALADILQLSNQVPAAQYQEMPIGCCGDNDKLLFDDMLGLMKQLEGSPKEIVSLNFGPKKPERVCLVSGSGADQLYRYQEDDFDTLITGEAKQFAYHYCKENKLNAIFAGHYATETLGVKRLAENLKQKFGITWEFIDEATGI